MNYLGHIQIQHPMLIQREIELKHVNLMKVLKYQSIHQEMDMVSELDQMN